MQSECRNAKAQPKRSTGKQHVRHTDQDCGDDEVPDDTEDEFLGSIFNLEEKRKPESHKSGLSAPAVKVPVQIEDVQFQMDGQLLQFLITQIKSGISNTLH